MPKPSSIEYEEVLERGCGGYESGNPEWGYD